MHSPKQIPFAFFVELVQTIAETKPKSSRTVASRHATTPSPAERVFTSWLTALRSCYSPLPPHTARIVFQFLFPDEDSTRKYGMQEARLAKYLAKVLGVNVEKGGRGRRLVEWMREDGDDPFNHTTEGCLGREVENIVREMCACIDSPSSGENPDLTFTSVDSLLTELAALCPFSASTIHSAFPTPRSSSTILRALFVSSSSPTSPSSNSYPVACALITQLILKDLRPLLYPLPADATTHYTSALMRYKSNSVAMLTISQALRIWDNVMCGAGVSVTRMWRVRGWAAFDEGAIQENEDTLMGHESHDDSLELEHDLERRQEEDANDPDPEIRADAYPSTSRTATPTVGLPVAIPKSVKAVSCVDALRVFARSGQPTGAVWAETKYDGERAQIHVQLESSGEWKITIYSKSGRNSTWDRAGLHETIRDALGLTPDANRDGKTSIAREAILDAEMVAYDDALGRVDEFWRIRGLIGASAIGPRARRSRVHPHRPQVSHAIDSSQSQSQTSEYDPDADSQTSSVSTDSPLHRRLALVFFDVLALDGASLLDVPYRARRMTLESVVRVRVGHVMLAARTRVSGPGGRDGAEALRHAMAACVAEFEEGLVLKAEEGRYGDWRVPWVKLKKDYIPGYGDCVDLVLLGAGWDKERARELRVAPTVYTTFYIGARISNSVDRRVSALKSARTKDRTTSDKPHFEVLFTASYGLSRKQLEELNFMVRSSECVECTNTKDPLPTSALPYTYNIYGGITRPGPAVLLTTPLLAEVMGASFTKEPHSKYYTLRFPRIVKVYRESERTWRDGVSLGDLQRIAREAVGREQKGKAEDDWCTDLFGKLPSPSIRAPEKQREREALWVGRLERTDGVVTSSSRPQMVNKRKRETRGDYTETGVRDKAGSERENAAGGEERRVRQRREGEAILGDFVQGSSGSRQVQKSVVGEATVKRCIGSELVPKALLPLQALGSVTNTFPAKSTPSHIRSSIYQQKTIPPLVLLTPSSKRAALHIDAFPENSPPVMTLATPTRERDASACHDKDIVLLTPPPSSPLAVDMSDVSHHDPTVVAGPCLLSSISQYSNRQHARTPLNLFLSRAVIFLSRPYNSIRRFPVHDVIPTGHEVHTLDALLLACGWSAPSTVPVPPCAWADHGAVFIDFGNADDKVLPDTQVWTDARFPLRRLFERRQTLLEGKRAPGAIAVMHKTIWVFDMRILSEAQLGVNLGGQEVESRALCRFG